MAPRTSTAARYIVDEVASPEATKRLFGIDDQRAATLSQWVAEALEAQAEPQSATQPPSSKGSKAARQASKRLRRGGPKKASAKR
jgi:hypothetical protein